MSNPIAQPKVNEGVIHLPNLDGVEMGDFTNYADAMTRVWRGLIGFLSYLNNTQFCTIT